MRRSLSMVVLKIPLFVRMRCNNLPTIIQRDRHKRFESGPNPRVRRSVGQRQRRNHPRVKFKITAVDQRRNPNLL